MSVSETGSGDYIGVSYHGFVNTHIDALCHVWSEAGMWGGRDPAEAFDAEGARWGAIHHWRDGIGTRGGLLDVPKHRGGPVVAAAGEGIVEDGGGQGEGDATQQGAAEGSHEGEAFVEVAVGVIANVGVDNDVVGGGGGGLAVA